MENILRGLADGQLAQGQRMAEGLQKNLLQKVLNVTKDTLYIWGEFLIIALYCIVLYCRY